MAESGIAGLTPTHKTSGPVSFEELVLQPCVVFTWGKAEDGQLGLSTVLTQQDVPQRVPRFPPMCVLAVVLACVRHTWT